MKKVIWVVVIVVVVGVLIGSMRTEKTEAGPIKIGFIDPLSGGAASFGESTKAGYDLAIKEINEAGGINGRTIELIAEDGKCNGKDSATAAQKLISIDKVKYMVGMICSGEVLGVAPISEQNKVILLVHGSSPDITEAGEYIFRTSPSDMFSAQKIAEHAIEKGLKQVAIIVENTEYSIALEKAFETIYTNLGGKILISESYAPDTTDFRSVLTKIKATKPEMLFIDAQNGVNAARIASQARELGLTAQFYGAFFTGPEYVTSGTAVNGSHVADVPSLNISNPRAAEFMEKIKNLTNKEISYPFFAAASYDQMNLLAKVFKEIDYQDTEAVKDYLSTVKDYDGVIGKFGFDEKGDVIGIVLRMTKIENNKVVEE